MTRNLDGGQGRNARVTQLDIARVVGTDRSTVSRVMNPQTRQLISADLVERVLKAVGDLGYRPNMAAASLRTQRSHTIGVVITDVTNPFFPPLLMAFEESIGQFGYLPIVASVGGSAQRESGILENFISRQVDGIVLATSQSLDRTIEECARIGIPLTLVLGRDRLDRVSSVLEDGRLGSAMATEHLVTLGHRHIAHVAGPRRAFTSATREAGYRDSMKLGRLRVGANDVVLAAEYSRQAGREACRQLLRKQRPTAIVAANDLLAMGCLDALSESGLQCPRDVSLTGYGDAMFADLLSPGLTTVRVDSAAIGRAAGRVLLQELQGAAGPKTQLVLPPELIVRNSTQRAG